MALSVTEEQQKIVDSILDSVYLKLLSTDATEEAIQQMTGDAGLEVKGDYRGFTKYLVGKLLFKITENFLDEKEINSQQCRKALEILKNLNCGAIYEYSDEYAKQSSLSSSAGIGSAGIGSAVRACAVNMAIRKLEQECPNLDELRKILLELDILENE